MSRLKQKTSERPSSTRWPLLLGSRHDGEDLCLPLEALDRHAVILGKTGSGKSVLAKAIVECCLAKCLPVIAIDLQGDLAALAFNRSSDALVADGIPNQLIEKFQERVEPIIWTPGSTLGTPLSMAPSLIVPCGLRPEDRARVIGGIARSIAAMAGDTSDAALAGIGITIDIADRHDWRCSSIEELIGLLRQPPPQLIDDLEPLLDKRGRAKIAKGLLAKMKGPSSYLFSTGQALDVDQLFGLYTNGGPASRGKARLSIISLLGLSPDQQQDFIALLCRALHSWMVKHDGSQPMGMLFLDEVAPFLPPVRKPPAKEPLSLLLRQGRKFGCYLLLATQSPGDLDYKCLSQVGTWALGRMSTSQELRKLRPALSAFPDADEILSRLPGKQPGEFTLLSHALDEPVEFKARRTMTEHRNIPSEEIERFVSDEERRILGAHALPGRIA